jgi:hypothetical protein
MIFFQCLNRTAQKYLEKTQSEVKYCLTCQPYDGDKYVWVLGEETTLDEIFEELNVPEKYRDDIACHIKCYNCGASNFDRYDVIGKEDHFNLETEKKQI